ncbi:MAG TPA: hypothetical protein VFH08_20260 [Chitinophagaceae bacterium]|nr:hypothetical protein [Chitinophagaceae bacterium]
MKQLFPAAAFLFVVFLASCDSKPDNKEQIAAPSVLPSATTPVLQGSNDSLGASNQGVALNPQHGEPGHRCDLAVGAPLNAPATNSTIQPNVSTSVPVTTTPAPKTDPKKVTSNPAPATTALNPKHGEPGHRCDIAVGAPLSGKPQ